MRQRTWRTMDRGSWHCTGGSDQEHPQERKCKKAKFWGGLVNSWEKKRSCRQRRKGKINHLNAEFQRIARREKKAFLSDQCKEIEENNRMGMTRDLFKKIRDSKGTFHAKMGSIRDRNGMDLTEAEGIKKRWQEYIQELYKKDLHDPGNHDGVITHLEPDILECEVKWALEIITANKASGGDGIPAELFQILKDDAVKVLHSICQQIWKTQQWPHWKRSVFIPIPKKGNAKECSNYYTIALISHASKVMLKILQARLKQYVNCELPDVQAGFRKDRGTRDQIASIHCIIKKQENSRKTSTQLHWGREMATGSSTLVWEIPWMEVPGGLQSMGSQRVRHDLSAKQQQQDYKKEIWLVFIFVHCYLRI